MQKLGHIINVRLNQHKLGNSARASEIIYKANQYLSQWLQCEKTDVNAFRLKNSVLSIGVCNSVWAQEVFSVSAKLLKTLQGHYGKKVIQKICTKSLTIV